MTDSEIFNKVKDIMETKYGYQYSTIEFGYMRNLIAATKEAINSEPKVQSIPINRTDMSKKMKEALQDTPITNDGTFWRGRTGEIYRSSTLTSLVNRGLFQFDRRAQDPPYFIVKIKSHDTVYFSKENDYWLENK